MDELFNVFFNKYNNKYCDFDGAYGAQCVDLVEFWGKLLAAPVLAGDAKDFQDQTLGFYIWIPNTPDNNPRVGDIVVWSGDYNNDGGHCGIATGKGDTNTFEVFVQNDPLGANCQLKTYNYTDVVGWLRPPSLVTTVQVDSVTFQKLVSNSTSYDSVCDFLSIPRNTAYSPQVENALKASKNKPTDTQYVTNNPILTPLLTPIDPMLINPQSVPPSASLDTQEKTASNQSFFSKLWEALWGK